MGVILYMGIHYKPQIELYLNPDFAQGPLYIISAHLSLRRFKQIKRYYHVSCLDSDE